MQKSKARAKLRLHRQRALNGSRNRDAMSPSEYAQSIHLSPQRIGRLLAADSAILPTLREAVMLHKTAGIKPLSWLEAA